MKNKKKQMKSMKDISILEYFPYIGKVHFDNQNRILIYKRYLIFYEIRENEKVVLIKRIRHSMQNIR